MPENQYAERSGYPEGPEDQDAEASDQTEAPVAGYRDDGNIHKIQEYFMKIGHQDTLSKLS